MLRQILIDIVLFSLPFICWFIYVRAMGRGDVSVKGPWLRLAAVGVVLIGVSLVALRFSNDAPPDAVYIPSHMEDGKLVKGKMVPPSETPAEEPAQ